MLSLNWLLIRYQVPDFSLPLEVVLLLQAEVWHPIWAQNITLFLSVTVLLGRQKSQFFGLRTWTRKMCVCVCVLCSDVFSILPLFLDHQVCPGSTQGSEEPSAQRSAKETSHPQVQERYGGKLKHLNYL